MKLILKGFKSISNANTTSFFAFIFLLTILFSLTANGKIHEYTTSQLKSMGGAGVGAVSLDESAFLNPAGLSYFNLGSIYFQKDLIKVQRSNGSIVERPKETGVVLSDSNQNLSGSFSYTLQDTQETKRSRFGVVLSGRIMSQSSFGVSIRKSEDEYRQSGAKLDYYQTVLGVIHAISEKASIGIVAYDPFKSPAHETKALLGGQFLIAEYISLALDVGANYTIDDISSTVLYRGGLQIKVLNDLFLRFGAFNDKERAEKGTGFGLAWIGPKLSFNFGLYNTKMSANAILGSPETKSKDTSFSISYRF